MGCCITVREATVQPLLVCGRFNSFAQAGCMCVGPCTTSGDTLDLSLKQSHIGIGTRTKDNVWVTIDVVVHWRVCLGPQDVSLFEKDFILEMAEHHDIVAQSSENLKALTHEQLLYRACFASEDPLAQITSHTEEYFRITVAQHTMDKLFDLGNSLTASCQSLLNATMNEYGYCVQKVVINAIHPEERVKAAMNDIVASEKERLAAITRACADKERRIKIAEAAAEVSRLHGEGLANQRFAIVEGLKQNVDEFSLATHENQEAVMGLLLMTQYTDTLKESIAGNKKVSLILNGNNVNAMPLSDETFKSALLQTNSVKQYGSV